MTSGEAPERSPESSEPPLAPGTKIGEYEVQKLLGEGGFGAVYSAVHPLIGKSAAVKVLKHEFSAKPDIVARFMSEARAVNQIRHRNIIDIFSFGKLDDGRHYYVMELLEGTPLDRYLAVHTKISIAQAIPILRQLARALGAAHAAGITHRDIKPENVYLTFDDDQRPIPKLLDFGIAKLVVDNFSQHKTRSGIPMGTPLYMSPEQVHGTAVDHRSDIYSFGVLVFQMLTGKLPFEGATMMSVMMKQVSEPPPPPSSVDPTFPPALEGAVLGMLDKNPEERPQSIIEAVELLVEAAVKAGLATPAASTPAGLEPMPNPTPRVVARTPGDAGETTIAAIEGSDTLVASEATTQTGTSSQGDATARSSRRAVTAVGLAVVIGAVATGLYLARGREPAAVASQTAAPSATPESNGGESKDAPAASAADPERASPGVSPVESAPPAPSTIKVKIKTNVEGAEIWRGDARLGAAGDELELPRSGDAVELTVKKPGYLPQAVKLTANEDFVDAVVLQPAPSQAPPPSKTQPEYGSF